MEEKRECRECGIMMNEGYCIGGGELYICSELCLENHFGADNIEELDLGGDESDNYWTTWEDEDEDERCAHCGYARACINCNPENYI